MQTAAVARAASRAVAATAAPAAQLQAGRDSAHLTEQPAPGQSAARLGTDEEQLDMDADYTAMLLALDVLMPAEGESAIQQTPELHAQCHSQGLA